jgi:hypothetical protein
VRVGSHGDSEPFPLTEPSRSRRDLGDTFEAGSGMDGLELPRSPSTSMSPAGRMRGRVVSYGDGRTRALELDFAPLTVVLVDERTEVESGVVRT